MSARQTDRDRVGTRPMFATERVTDESRWNGHGPCMVSPLTAALHRKQRVRQTPKASWLSPMLWTPDVGEVSAVRCNELSFQQAD